MLGEMDGGLDHASRVARRAHAAPLAREGDEEVVPALPTMGPRETVGGDAAFEIATELALDVAGNRIGVVLRVAGEREPSREVGLDGAIQQRALGPPPAVRRRDVRRGLPHHRHASPLRPVNRDGRSWWRAECVPRDQTEWLGRGGPDQIVNV